MAYDFDRAIDRRASDSIKWNHYPADVLPLWVADMDFCSPPAVTLALEERASHGVYGYGSRESVLAERICERMLARYQWNVDPSHVVMLPGVTPGLSLASLAFAEPGEKIIIQSPVYSPIYRVPEVTGRARAELPLVRNPDGSTEVDFDAFETAASEGARLFVLCNPQNPTGRVFSRLELERFGELCLKHDVTICADEIHCDLVFDPHRHVPIASLSTELMDRTVTLMAPSKTFNIPGLQCSFAIIANAASRRRFTAAGMGLVPHVGALGVEAAITAYEHGNEWLEEALVYLAENRAIVESRVRSDLPGVSSALPEGTYLSWLDCRASRAGTRPFAYFLNRAKVALSDGAIFGPPGVGFVRLNFGCPRACLMEALDRMSSSLRDPAAVSPDCSGA